MRVQMPSNALVASSAGVDDLPLIVALLKHASADRVDIAALCALAVAQDESLESRCSRCCATARARRRQAARRWWRLCVKKPTEVRLALLEQLLLHMGDADARAACGCARSPSADTAVVG
jgi:hypothetical protein